jgi:hypothetical protein
MTIPPEHSKTIEYAMKLWMSALPSTLLDGIRVELITYKQDDYFSFQYAVSDLVDLNCLGIIGPGITNDFFDQGAQDFIKTANNYNMPQCEAISVPSEYIENNNYKLFYKLGRNPIKLAQAIFSQLQNTNVLILYQDTEFYKAIHRWFNNQNLDFKYRKFTTVPDYSDLSLDGITTIIFLGNIENTLLFDKTIPKNDLKFITSDLEPDFKTFADWTIINDYPMGTKFQQFKNEFLRSNSQKSIGLRDIAAYVTCLESLIRIYDDAIKSIDLGNASLEGGIIYQTVKDIKWLNKVKDVEMALGKVEFDEYYNYIGNYRLIQ